MADMIPTPALHTPLPNWVPEAAQVYLAHTETGQSIRSLARARGCHASTVLRQVRRVEQLRDDPLVNAALERLGAGRSITAGSCDEKGYDPMNAVLAGPVAPDETELSREARRVLRRLCESGAVLAVAADMDKAVVVRDLEGGGSTRTAVVDAEVAQALALKGWIACDRPARISRYRITQAGRSQLQVLVAEQENKVRGFAEAQAGFDTGRAAEQALEQAERDPRSRKAGRYMLAESPLVALARRREKDGTPFLCDRLVAAGERLREDFELAQLGQTGGASWDHFVAPMLENEEDLPQAQARLRAALRDLGPGLGDVALRCCCYLEGLETTEKQLGWSARSGKIVLRIALQRLRRHYDERAAQGGDLVG